MSNESIALEFEQVRETVSNWSREQDVLETELTESLAALGAYQTDLETWQQELVAGRESQAIHDQAAQSKLEARIEELTQLVAAGKKRITSLESDLLACNEELREAEEKRTEVITQLDAARSREKVLSGGSQQDKQAVKKQAQAVQKARSGSYERQNLNSRSEDSDSNVSDPVLSSVVAQFDKIRRQLAFGRDPNNEHASDVDEHAT